MHDLYRDGIENTTEASKSRRWQKAFGSGHGHKQVKRSLVIRGGCRQCETNGTAANRWIFELTKFKGVVTLLLQHRKALAVPCAWPAVMR